MTNKTLLKEHKTFGGKTSFWLHFSKITNSEMKFSTFIPDSPKINNCIIWLSGLTCTQENFIIKSGVQKYLADTDTMIICPDTSPRSLNLPLEHENDYFGAGASMYINATTNGYKSHYQMFDYVSKDIHNIITSSFRIEQSNISIMGHSIGGHGALILGLNLPRQYKCISAFAPVTSLINASYGEFALLGYIGDNQKLWQKYDACELIKDGKKHSQKILIDQGSDDEFKENLSLKKFIDICQKYDQPLEANLRDGYDHSYYFVSTFIESHIKYHLSNFNEKK